MSEQPKRQAVFGFRKAIPELGALPRSVVVIEEKEDGEISMSITFRVHPPAFPVVLEAIQDPSVTDRVKGDPTDLPPASLYSALKARAERTGIPEAESAVDQVLQSPEKEDHIEVHQLLDVQEDHKGRFRFAHAFLAKGPVPGTPIRTGDVLVHSLGFRPGDAGWRRTEGAFRVPAIQLPRSAFAPLARAEDLLECVGGHHPPVRFFRYLVNRKAQGGKDATSPIFILRSPRSPVSEPIQAVSDEAAIFELILSAGGQMPRRGQDHA